MRSTTTSTGTSPPSSTSWLAIRRCSPNSHQLCELALYSETLSNEFIERLRVQEAQLSQPQRAFMFWYVNRTRHNGVGGFSINTTVRRGMSKSTSDMLSSVAGLPALHDRLSSCNCDQPQRARTAAALRPGTHAALSRPTLRPQHAAALPVTGSMPTTSTTGRWSKPSTA